MIKNCSIFTLDRICEWAYNLIRIEKGEGSGSR